MSERKKYSPNQYTILYNEVDGLCPICKIQLIYEKGKSLNRRVNLAHIYPHSPKKDELEILKNVEKISDDLEDIKNIIWLCPNCHEKFDKPRTLDEYNFLLNLKKNILNTKEIKNEYYNYNIEDEIKEILSLLSKEEINEEEIELVLDPIVIDKKTNETITILTKRKIKNDVSDFFNIIQNEFKNIDSTNTNKSELIATQIKSFYLKISQNEKNQNIIFNQIVEWIHSKTNVSKEASSIIVSYFVQRCEVFDVISK